MGCTGTCGLVLSLYHTNPCLQLVLSLTSSHFALHTLQGHGEAGHSSQSMSTSGIRWSVARATKMQESKGREQASQNQVGSEPVRVKLEEASTSGPTPSHRPQQGAASPYPATTPAPPLET